MTTSQRTLPPSRPATLRVFCLLACCGITAPLAAQSEPAPPPPPQQQPEQPEQPPPPLPGLDELLGLDQTPEPRTEDPQAPDPNQSELEQRLSGREVAQAFQEAVRLMGDSAGRLRADRDVGLTTQRLQEEAIRKLDLLISQAQRQQQQQQSSSSSSRNRQDQQQPNQPQQSPQNQPGNRENRGQVDPPARQEGPLGPDATGSSAGWGNLPARVRDALNQSKDDTFSALYRAMTEAYYRRIAEEAGK